MSRTDVLKASPPMFESRLLDACSRVHPSVPVILFAPAIAILLTLGTERVGIAAALLWALGGYLLWTLTEYWMHRIVFHFEPEDGVGARLHWIIHGVHHDHPNDSRRLVMPPAASIPLAVVFALVFVATFGTPGAWPVLAGFLAGYLAYDMTHYHLHHHAPRTWVGRRLREQHMRHHFQDDTTGFGVSAPYWDRVFRTASDPRRRARASRAR